MTEEKRNEDNQAGSRRPTHVAYWVKEREHKESEWRPIGVAWTHAGGYCINISLRLQSLDGRITLRVIEEKEK
jgi:hypothetical protein